MTTTTDPARLRTIEQNAVRLLREGYSPGQVTERTGVTVERLKVLMRTPQAAARCEHDVTELPVKVLMAHPGNIRHDLEVDDDFVETIAEHGVLQPLLVMRQNGAYVLLDGHRRLEGARRANLPRVPIKMHDAVDDQDATVIMLVTGVHKRDLDPLDEAAAYQRLADTGMTHKQVGQAVGKLHSHVSHRIMLLLLTDDEQLALRQRALTIAQAYDIASKRGNNRKPGGSPERPKPKRVFHLTGDHALAAGARALCSASGHPVVMRLGPACGRCWEDVIRHDERSRVTRLAEREAAASMATPPP